MRIKHLLFMLLALPLAFVACEEPAPVDNVKEATVSIAVGEVGADYVSFTVTTKYAEESAWLVIEAAEATPTASEVLANGTQFADMDASFKAKDLKAETEYKVVAAVKNSKGVAIAEATATTLKEGEAPEKQEVVFTAEYISIDYYAAEDASSANNYYVILTDKALNGVSYANGSNNYLIDLYSATAATEEAGVLPNGVYTLSDTHEAGTFSKGEFGCLIRFSEDGKTREDFYYVDGTVTISAGKVEAEFEMADGSIHKVTFEGDLSWGDNGGNGGNDDPEPTPTPTPGDNVNFVAANFHYEYLGTDYSSAYNYYVVLSDVPMDGNSYGDNSINYVFDLYSNTGASQAKGVIPNGTYSLSSTYGAGTFSEDYGFRIRIIGDSEAEYLLYADGFVTVSDGKIEAQLEMEDGSIHTVVYEGDLSWGGSGNDTPREFEATHTADKWLWAGSSNYGNKYSVSGEGFSVDVHFPAQFAQQESITEDTYTWVSTTIFGYVDFENYFTTRSFTVNGSTVAVDGGDVLVSKSGDEFHIELTLDGRDGNTYMIQYDGKLNDTGSSDVTEGDIVLTSMQYKEYNGSYGFFTYTLTGESVTMELLVNDTSAQQYDIASGTYMHAPMKSLVGNPGYFYVSSLKIDGVSYSPQVNASMEVVSDGSTVSLTMVLPCNTGETITCKFNGSIQ